MTLRRRVGERRQPRSTRALLVASLAATIAVAAGVSSGCSGGDGADTFVGTLEVLNTAASADIVDAVQVDGVSLSFHAVYETNLLPGESLFVDLFPGDYDVTIYWLDGSFEVHPVTVFDDATTTLSVTF